MKTISGRCESSKPVSLSKAAKILSKFVSAENGASDVVNGYLHRASAAFHELNQLHKELNPTSHSHKKKKKHRIETTCDDNDDGREGVVDNSVRQNVLELHDSHVKSNNDFGRQHLGSENYSEEEGKKQKDKKKKKHENEKGHEQQKEIEEKLSNGVEGENGVQEIRKKKKHEAGSEDGVYAKEVKVEKKKKRKFEDVEDRSGEDLTEKRMKRKHDG